MYVIPQVIRVDLGLDHANQDIAFQLIVDTADGQRFKSKSVGNFVVHRFGEPLTTDTFRTDEKGSLDWISFVEPIEKQDDNRKHRMLSEDPFVVTTQDMGDVGISLRAMVGAGDLSVDLVGPQVRIPSQLWAKKPKVQVMGLIQILNPFNEGSVWRFLSRAAKYRNCINERRLAKTYLGDSHA